MHRKHLFAWSVCLLLFTGIPAGGAEEPQPMEEIRDICPSSGLLRSVHPVPSVEGLDTSRVLAGMHGQGRQPVDQTPSPTSPRPTMEITPWVDLHGPYGGYVMWIEIDETNPERLFCTTAGGGVFRSTDGAASWQASQQGMLYDWPQQIDIALDDPDLLFCAAMDRTFYFDIMGDVYKSTDGGLSWTSCGLDQKHYWSGVHIDPTDSSVILAGGSAGIWRSTDGGATWGQVLDSTLITTFCKDPSDTATIYAGSYGDSIYRSKDKGLSWIQLVIPGAENIRQVAVHSNDSATIFAADNPDGIYRSTDYGTSWNLTTTEFLAQGVSSAPWDGDTVIAVGERPFDPVDPPQTPRILFSEDGGDNWTLWEMPTDHFYAPFANRTAFHPTDPGVIYVGCYQAGVFKTTDYGESWEDSNTGLKACFINAVLAHPTDPQVIWAAPHQCSLYKTTDGGQHWFHSDSGYLGSDVGRTIGEITMDPHDPDHLLMGAWGSSLWQSFDGGDYWETALAPAFMHVDSVKFSSSDPGIAWAGTIIDSRFRGLWKSTDGGTIWEKMNGDVHCQGVAIQPNNPDTVIGVTYDSIVRTTDGGDSWEVVHEDAHPDEDLTDCCFCPTDSTLAWAVCNDYTNLSTRLLGSTDGGATWDGSTTLYPNNSYIYSFTPDPMDPMTVYIPMDLRRGFRFTEDRGETWQSHSVDLWQKSLSAVHVARYPANGSKTFFLGTQGNGVFMATTPIGRVPAVAVGPGPGPQNPPLVRVFPAQQGAGHVFEFTPYGADGHGVNLSCGDMDGDGLDEILTGAGPGAVYGPHVRGFRMNGLPLPGLNFLAYGTNRWGVNVAAGDLDADGIDEVITGAGPGAVFGPHVRTFDYDGEPPVTPMAGCSFFAYGTPKWGVNVSAGDIDGDGFEEIVTGAGPGAVYGPHVRGWNVDGGPATPITGINFMAYGTNKYGVNVTCGDIDGDGIDEVVTGAGPGQVFGAHVRGWNYDGAVLSDISGINFFAWPPEEARYGANVFAGADLDGDGRDELAVGAGPDPMVATPVRIYRYDGMMVSMWLSLAPFEEMSHGAKVTTGWF